MLRRSRELFRIERQEELQPLDRVRHNDAEDAEEKQRRRVLLPVLGSRLFKTTQSQQESLDGAQRAAEGLPLTFEHAIQVNTKWLGQRQDDQQEQSDLQPTVKIHGDLRSAPA